MKNEIKQGRGEVTERIKVISKASFGYEFGKTELRLLPYLQYLVTNSDKIDSERVNEEDMEIIKKWTQAGYITSKTGEKLKITQDFWIKMTEIIYLGYVDLH